ncbi:MAG TPA: ABC transporter substrate-binding protein [Alphaproteobacteria bacterium]|nr:ABC transporter substrate-binding protein [Alphaproteobacteria bacterium]
MAIARLFQFALLFALLSAPIAARASQASEQFIAERAVKVVAILNGSQPIAQKRDGLTQLVEENVGIERIAYYTLGQYRAGASQEELEGYVAAFRDYLFAYYIKPAAGFSGITLTVTGSTDVPDGKGSIVHTIAKTPGSAKLDWYVLDDSTIVDVEIAGISAAKLLRAQVTAVLALSGGKVSAATDLLKTLVGKA